MNSEKRTLWDILKDEITVKVYVLVAIFFIGVIVGSVAF